MLRRVVSALLTSALCVGAHAQNLTEIKVSYQPALYWSLPFYVATEKGWWAELGLKPVFTTFPAGVPQIAASVSKSWDVGGTGSVPAVLGQVRFGIKTIGITNDESAGNSLVVSGAKAAAFAKDPKLMKGQVITLTANSTGDYAVQACLKKYGLSKQDVTLKNMGQAEIISALSSSNTDLAGLWAPNTYTVEEKAGAKILCSGKDGGVVVPGALIARGDYAAEHPENVAKFLAIYLRSWKWLNAHKTEAIAMMKKFYDQGGVSISDASMRKEFDTRPTYDLAQQLAAMSRARGNSDADVWFGQIAIFMRQTGAIQTIPASQDYLTDQYMRMVQSDTKLRDFANKSN
jgi:NitT/TauT family transport system substrate-binding protein